MLARNFPPPPRDPPSPALILILETFREQGRLSRESMRSSTSRAITTPEALALILSVHALVEGVTASFRRRLASSYEVTLPGILFDAVVYFANFLSRTSWCTIYKDTKTCRQTPTSNDVHSCQSASSDATRQVSFVWKSSRMAENTTQTIAGGTLSVQPQTIRDEEATDRRS